MNWIKNLGLLQLMLVWAVAQTPAIASDDQPITEATTSPNPQVQAGNTATDCAGNMASVVGGSNPSTGRRIWRRKADPGARFIFEIEQFLEQHKEISVADLEELSEAPVDLLKNILDRRSGVEVRFEARWVQKLQRLFRSERRYPGLIERKLSNALKQRPSGALPNRADMVEAIAVTEAAMNGGNQNHRDLIERLLNLGFGSRQLGALAGSRSLYTRIINRNTRPFVLSDDEFRLFSTIVEDFASLKVADSEHRRSAAHELRVALEADANETIELLKLPRHALDVYQDRLSIPMSHALCLKIARLHQDGSGNIKPKYQPILEREARESAERHWGVRRQVSAARAEPETVEEFKDLSSPDESKKFQAMVEGIMMFGKTSELKSLVSIRGNALFQRRQIMNDIFSGVVVQRVPLKCYEAIFLEYHQLIARSGLLTEQSATLRLLVERVRWAQRQQQRLAFMKGLGISDENIQRIASNRAWTGYLPLKFAEKLGTYWVATMMPQ